MTPDDITLLAERAADMLDGFEQALRRYAPIEDIEEWPYHPDIVNTAAELRTLAQQQGKAGDRGEGKVGVVLEGLPVHPYVRARTLLTLLWQKYDAGGVSMGRSFEAVCLEAAMDLLEDFRDSDDVMRCDSDSGNVMDDTRTYLSRQRANREGLAKASKAAAAGAPKGWRFVPVADHIQIRLPNSEGFCEVMPSDGIIFRLAQAMVDADAQSDAAAVNPQMKEVIALGNERQQGYANRENGSVVNGMVADKVVAIARRLAGGADHG